MKAWPVHDAKAHFSELLEACVINGPQLVTKHGADAAVLVSAAEWRQMSAGASPSLKKLLLSDAARTEFLVPPRGAVRRRCVAAMR